MCAEFCLPGKACAHAAALQRSLHRRGTYCSPDASKRLGAHFAVLLQKPKGVQSKRHTHPLGLSWFREDIFSGKRCKTACNGKNNILLYGWPDSYRYGIYQQEQVTTASPAMVCRFFADPSTFRKRQLLLLL